MFHAPTSDSKQRGDHAKTNPSPQKQGGQPNFNESLTLGIPPVMGGRLPSPTATTPRRQKLARLQRAYGNQVVLRMLRATAIQPKLVFRQVDDPLEREADRIADQVMPMPDPEFSTSASPPQVSRNCAACEEHEARTLRTKPAGASEAAAGEAPSVVHDVLCSPGQPLDAATRRRIETRFGHDFGNVRIHTDERAGRSAQALNAWAYTANSDIVFAPARYDPQSELSGDMKN